MAHFVCEVQPPLLVQSSPGQKFHIAQGTLQRCQAVPFFSNQVPLWEWEKRRVSPGGDRCAA